MRKKCPFCAEEILTDAKKCKHCGEFIEKNISNGTSNKRILKIIISIVIVVLVYNFFSALSTNAEYNRNIYESYNTRTDTYRLPSGKVIDLINVPSEYKHEVKTYLSYKDKRNSWSDKSYEDRDDSDAEYQVEIFDNIIEKYEIEHPRVRENSFKIKRVKK